MNTQQNTAQDISFTNTVVLKNVYLAPASDSDPVAEATYAAQLVEEDRQETRS